MEQPQAHNRHVVAIGLAALLLAALVAYIVSYFWTSRVIPVAMTPTESRPVRIFDKPWQRIYTPLAAVEKAVRPGFGGVAFKR
jgi:hypothetical protein